MFKKYLLLVICLVLIGQLQAQVTYLKPHFGLRIGGNISYTTLSPNFIYNLKYQSHPNLGVFYRVRLGKFVLQPEVQLTVKGGTFSREEEVIRNNFNYLAVVPVLGYTLTEGLTAEIAPEFNFALNSPGPSFGPAKKRDTGLAVGFRYDFMDIAEDFSLNLRYLHGFSNVSGVANETQYNRTLQVSVIYNFYKKK
jgi:Outer membrane protein beta-barrel domain